MNKTLRAFVLPLLLFFTLSTVTAPARAILPVIAAGVAMMTEGGIAANGIAALTVGTVAGMVYLGTIENGAGSESGSFMEVPLGTSRSRPLTLPPGYAAAATNDGQPVPPSSVAATQKWASDNVVAGQFFDTPEALCSAVNAADSRYGPNVRVDNATTITCTSAGYNYPTATLRSTCAAGYTVSGSSCVLSNAAAVQKPADGRCQILMNVSGFVVDPQDPECGSLAANTSTTVTPTSVSFTKPGTLTNGSVVINPDGSRTVTYSTANTVNNTTTTTTINMIPASGGQTAQVSGSSTTVVNGTGTAAGTAPVAPSIDFPDDYNREATQAAIKANTDTLLANSEVIKNEMTTPPGVPNTLAPAVQSIDQSATDFKASIDGIATAGSDAHGFVWDWSPIIPSATCAPPVINFAGKAITLDWCPTVEKIRDFAGYAFYLFTAYSLFGILTARRED